MFTGFSPETIDFLWGIRLNNRKDWFESHKQQYISTLFEPMKALGATLYEPFQEVQGLVCKVSRIYRDARYAQGNPYKESLWISIRRESDFWSEHPCLFFEITPDDYSYGFINWSPRADAMARYRALLEEKPDAFLKLVQKTTRDTGISLTGKQYCRKKPCPDTRLESYYNLKNLQCYITKPTGPELFEPQLAHTVTKALQDLLPLNEFCQKFAY